MLPGLACDGTGGGGAEGGVAGEAEGGGRGVGEGEGDEFAAEPVGAVVAVAVELRGGVSEGGLLRGGEAGEAWGGMGHGTY